MGDFAISSAGYVTGDSGCDSVVHSALPFVEVRVMDIGFDESSSPRECGMALCAPHLVTPFYFEDAGSAFGAWFGVIVEENCGGDVIWIAYVIFFFDFVAFRTSGFSASATFPL